MTAPSSITLNLEQYEALIALAKQGSPSQQQQAVLNQFLQEIEQDNGITRYSLYIRWQDPNAPLPPGVRFPETWPPNLEFFLQLLTRPICLNDVMQVVNSRTTNAQNIMVTPDPAGLVGWTQLSNYFVNPTS